MSSSPLHLHSNGQPTTLSRVTILTILHIPLILDSITRHLGQSHIRTASLVNSQFNTLFTPQLYHDLYLVDLHLSSILNRDRPKKSMLTIPSLPALTRHHRKVRSLTTSIRLVLSHVIQAGCSSLKYIDVQPHTDRSHRYSVSGDILINLLHQNTSALQTLRLQDSVPAAESGSPRFFQSLSNLGRLTVLDMALLKLPLRSFLLLFKYLPTGTRFLALTFLPEPLEKARSELAAAKGLPMERGRYLDDGRDNDSDKWIFHGTTTPTAIGSENDFADLNEAFINAGGRPLACFGQCRDTDGDSFLQTLIIRGSMEGYERSVFFPILRHLPRLEKLGLPATNGSYLSFLVNIVHRCLPQLRHLDLEHALFTDTDVAQVIDAVSTTPGLVSIIAGENVVIQQAAMEAILRCADILERLELLKQPMGPLYDLGSVLSQCQHLQVLNSVSSIHFCYRWEGALVTVQSLFKQPWLCLTLKELTLHMWLDQEMDDDQVTQIYIQLGQLRQLEVLRVKLSLSPRFKVVYGGVSGYAHAEVVGGTGTGASTGSQTTTGSRSAILEMSLRQGLGRMEGLKRLRQVDFHNVAHSIGEPELLWVAKQWPSLERIVGLWSQRMSREAFDRFKELRPDVATQ